MHKFYQKQVLPVSRMELWDFISVPQNLNQITPPEMSFETIGTNPAKLHAGLLLEYRVNIPLLGRTTWLTEIKYLEEGFSFMDEQRVGPYKLWLHTHTLRDVKSGAEMTDEIRYLVPFGIFGKFANFVFVRRSIKKVFEYRKRKLVDLYG